MNEIEFNTLLNNNRDLIKTKVDVLTLYTHYYLINKRFQLRENGQVRMY